MNPLRTFRRVAWACVAVASGLFFAVTGGWMVTDGPFAERPVPQAGRPIAADFELIDHLGRPFTRKELTRKPTLLFFGFTYCPEVCPTTLSDIGAWLDALGPDADRIQPVFVTVDPERDTREALAAYVEPFDARILAVSGPAGEIDKLASSYRTVYRKVPDGAGGYTMDHTASVHLLDQSTRLVGAIDFHENATTALAKIRRLLQSTELRN